MRPLYLGVGLLASLLALPAISGCSGASSYQTETSVARGALEASLNAWKSGEKAESLTSRQPVVHAVDEQWKSGKTLSGFEILAEGTADGNTYFDVKLSRGKEPVIETRFYVVGVDPIWVYRAEDYARLINMDDNPRKKTSRKGVSGSGPG